MKQLEYTVHPIVLWPGARTPAWQRKRAPFKANWTETLTFLNREVAQLRGRNVKIRLDVKESELRQDGQLRSNARPKDPGVLLEFVAGKLKGEPILIYRCDTFGFWQDNLDAIGRALEALRLVDRYGVTPTGEQYAGFKALPSATAPTMGVVEAAVIIAGESDTPNAATIAESASVAKQAVRVAVFRTHPDRNNGVRTAFDRVEAARKVLTALHGVTI